MMQRKMTRTMATRLRKPRRRAVKVKKATKVKKPPRSNEAPRTNQPSRANEPSRTTEKLANSSDNNASDEDSKDPTKALNNSIIVGADAATTFFG